MSSSVLQALPIVSGFIAALSTIAALFWGVWTYRRNAAHQVQLLALGALQHYLDLAVAHPDLASRNESEPVDARYAWFAAHALATAQTLWIVAGADENWRRPVDSIIRQHHAYLSSGTFVCGDYRPDFVSYLRSRVADLKCAPAIGATGSKSWNDGFTMPNQQHTRNP